MRRAAGAVAAAKSAVRVRLTAVRDRPAKAVKAAWRGDVPRLTALLNAGVRPNTTNTRGFPLLHGAAVCGHKHIVSLLLDRGADIHQKDRNGSRALHIAARFGKPDVVSLLLARGADVGALGWRGRTVLMFAAECKTDNRAVVAALCGAGAQVNAVSAHKAKTTALLLACQFGTAGTVAALLDAGADIEQKQRNGDRALHRAAFAGKRDVVSLLLARGADIGAPGFQGRTALMSAASCATDNGAVVAALCGAGAQVNAVSEHKEKTTALILACEHGTPGTVAALLNAGADIEQENGDGNRALHRAAIAGKPDVVSLLLARGADVGALGEFGRTALMAAAQCATDNRAVVAALCGAGAQVNTVSKHEAKTTALTLACQFGTAGTVAALLNVGADMEQKDGDGDNAITVAAWAGKTDTVDLLLQRGADIHSKNNDGATPLFMSSQSGALESTKLLIAKGAKLNARNDDKVTPLAVASENKKHEIVTLLLKHKADPDLADREGLTALHKSVLQNNIESFKLLIAAGVKLDVQSITGCTELHYATKDKRLEMLNMLVNAKCNTNVEDHLGNVPLHVAALNSHVDSLEIYKQIVSILLSNKANINHINNYGESPIAISTVTLNLEMMKFLHAKNGDLKCLDSMDRSLIHKAVEALIDAIVLTDAKLSTGKLVIEWLIMQGLSINAQDVNLQTPLHLAAKTGKKELVSYLIGIGADVTARDSLGHLPLMCALQHSTVFQYLWDHSIKHLNDKDFCTLQRLTYWLGLGHDLMKQIKEFSKTQVPLENMPQKVQPLKCKYDACLARWLESDSEELPDFMSDWLSSLQQLTYIDHPTLNDVMWDFLKHLQEGVRKEDPLVAYLITRCGSVDEKTKVFAQDECDCSCVQENIKFHMFEEPTKPDHEEWTAFVHMKCKDKYVDQLRRILDKQNRLSQGKLCHYFGKAIARVLSKAKFWRRYPQLQRITPKDISAGDRRICTMHVIWSDEICPFLMIDIDLAPVVDLKSWKPSWCNRHPLMHLINSIALPKWKITPDVDMDLMEIGVHGWGPLFHKMPEQMRQGYRLAKVVRGSAVCPQISLAIYEWCDAGTFMNTYLLKQVIMHEFQAWYDQKEDGLEPQVHTDIYWARRIYEKMEEAFKSRKLYSWYIPSYNLLTDDKFKYKDIAVMYAKLCRRLLTEEAAVHFRRAYMGGPVDATLDISRLAISHS